MLPPNTDGNNNNVNPSNHQNPQDFRNNPPPQGQPNNRGGIKKVIKFLFSTILSLHLLTIVTLAGVIALVYFMFATPPYLSEYDLNRKILDEISQLTDVNVLDKATTFATVVDSEKLKGENEIQEEVYKDVQNNDYVVVFTNEMIIYRRSEKKIIYEGLTPVAIYQEQTNTLVNGVKKAINDSGLLAKPLTEEEVPQLVMIDDVAVLKEQDAEFYKDARKGDLIASLQNGLVVIYRPETGVIVNSGYITTTIQGAST